MRVLVTNLVEDATLTATNENASYPVENCYANDLIKLYKATGTTSTVTITWTGDQTVNCLGFAYHNISEVVYTLKNAAAATLETDTLTAGSDEIYDGDIIYLSSSYSNVRSITLAFTGSSDPFYIGYIGAGVYTSLPSIAAGPRRPKQYNSFNYTSLGGQQTGTKITGLRSFQANFDPIGQTDMTTLETFLDSVMDVDKFIFDPYESDRVSFLPMYARCTNITGPLQKAVHGVVYEASITFQECR